MENIDDLFFNTADFNLTDERIGEGSFGNVYIAQNLKDGQKYAAKILNVEKIFIDNSQKNLIREIQILSKINHPSIVKFYGITFQSFKNRIKFEPTILTEYLPNGSLKDILDKEKRSIVNHNWTPTKKYITLLGISHAMKYLHKAGVIHRDLKPENVLEDENYYPKICDFGLSRCFPSSLTKSVQISMTGNVGTPLYMAPELLNDDNHYGPGVDVYAFAFIAYEIVSGKVPFFERGPKMSYNNLLSLIKSGARPKFPSFVHENMVKLISSCWNEDPADRLSFEEIFQSLSGDFSFFHEDVDVDEIKQYIEFLDEVKEEKLVNNTEIISEYEKTRQAHRICNERECFLNIIKYLVPKVNLNEIYVRGIFTSFMKLSYIMHVHQEI